MSQGVPGSLRPRIFLTFGTTRVVVRQPYSPAAFTPGEIPGTHFHSLSRPRAHDSVGGSHGKNPAVTPPGIDPGTLRLAAQCINLYATPVWGWQPHHLQVANVMKIWEPKPPGTLWATPGLLGTPLPLPFLHVTKLLMENPPATDQTFRCNATASRRLVEGSFLQLWEIEKSLACHNCLSIYPSFKPAACRLSTLTSFLPRWNTMLRKQPSTTRVGSLIVATIYLQLIQNRYMFRSFTVLQCSHQHCVQPVASDVEVVGYL